MNGRVYDYALGRFLSVDPFIQFPLNSQSLNPYSYLGNNPLSGTDPTGYEKVCDAKGQNCSDVTHEAPTGSHIKSNTVVTSSNEKGSASVTLNSSGHVVSTTVVNSNGAVGQGAQAAVVPTAKPPVGASQSGQAPKDFQGDLKDPAKRQVFLRNLANYKGTLIPDKDITYKDVDGPLLLQGRAGAETNPTTGEMVFYRNAFKKNNFWIISSIMDHEYSHWLDHAFGRPQSSSPVDPRDQDEIRAYKRQEESPDFLKTPEYFRSGVREVRESYEHDFRVETGACKHFDRC